ncbi:2-hydroxyacid dehydrogenase [Hydrogenophaga sp. H7]|uniref:2-hydroxyacid dehydrogenase n=1 Tax=Hydrogenophaga sp. H7 TaxID=1882399 RepID=UPI0009A2FD42|nr:2-hydroxyacid dehydrogenase [Hydrogenophaga sp. H7]OPF65502.1 hydroxyacid dehydrogenase [Hydrogenophaga sp. H7]
MTAAAPRSTVLQVGPLMPALEARLREQHTVLSAQATTADAPLADRADAARVAAVVTSAPVGVPAAWLAQLPALKVVSSFGVGLDRLPLDAARAAGLPVGYTPDVLNDCVADLAMGLLIDGARRIAAADRFVRRGDWLQGRYPMTTRVSGKRLGIVGLGRIGQAVARRAAGFDMDIAYCNRGPAEGVAWRYEPSLMALAQWADFLVLTVAASPATHHLVNAEVLRALGPKGLLVNVARGSVVDEAALIASLQSGELGGAALDVFDDEPRVPAALLAMEQVVLAPHMASGTHDTRQAMADLTLANLRAGLAGEPLPDRAA